MEAGARTCVDPEEDLFDQILDDAEKKWVPGFADFVGQAIGHLTLNVEPLPFVLEYDRALDRIKWEIERIRITGKLKTNEIAVFKISSMEYVTLPDTVPSAALASKSSYIANMCASASIAVRDSVFVPEEKLIIGTMPVMVGSRRCLSKSPPATVPSFDARKAFPPMAGNGYMVTEGIVRQIIPETNMKLATHRYLVRTRKRGPRGSFVGMCYYQGLTRPNEKNTVILNYVRGKPGAPPTLVQRFPGTQIVVALGLILRAFGVTMADLRARCQMIPPGSPTWRSSSLTLMDDPTLTAQGACDMIYESSTATDLPEYLARITSSQEFVLALVFPDIPCGPGDSPSEQKLQALLFLMQIMIKTIETRPDMVDNNVGPIMFTYDHIVDALADPKIGAIQAFCKKVVAAARRSNSAAEWYRRISRLSMENAIMSSIRGTKAHAATTAPNSSKQKHAIASGGVKQQTTTHAARRVMPYSIALIHPPELKEPGTVCDVTGPKSSNCHRSRRLACGAFVSGEVPRNDVVRLIGHLLLGGGPMPVVLDGVCIGYSRAPPAKFKALIHEHSKDNRQFRAVTCVHVSAVDVLQIFSCAGRLCFHAFDLERIRALSFNRVFRDTVGLESDEAIKYLLDTRVLVVLDDACTAESLLAVGFTQKVLETPAYTHAIPIPQLAMSLDAIIANPRIFTNPPVRIINAAAMLVTQGFGLEVPPKNFTGIIPWGYLNYPQRQFVCSLRAIEDPTRDGSADDGRSQRTFANGQNMVVAFMPDLAADKEAVIINADTMMRGGLATTIMKPYTNTRPKYDPGELQAAMDHVRKISPADMEYLDSDGIIAPGSPVAKGSIIMFRFTALEDKDGKPKFIDTSMRHRLNTSGFVTSVCVQEVAPNTPHTDIIVRVVISSTLGHVGPKITFGAWKGVGGFPRRAVDMPVDKDGIPPDIIITALGLKRLLLSIVHEQSETLNYCKNPDSAESARMRTTQHCTQPPDITSLLARCAMPAPVATGEIDGFPDQVSRLADSLGAETSHYFDGRTGVCLGKVSRISGRFEAADLGFGIAYASTLAQVADVKAHGVNITNVRKDATGCSYHGSSVDGGKHIGHMELSQGTYYGNPFQEMILDTNAKDTRFCKECHSECTRDAGFVFVCPRGHPAQSIARYKQPAASRVFINELNVCGVQMQLKPCAPRDPLVLKHH